jgi:hypothetical protein
MQQEYSHVKLHVTVMNTLMRRDPTSIPGERPPEGKQGTKERESFDAMNVMKVRTVSICVKFQIFLGLNFESLGGGMFLEEY